jgi:hypothetical protein
VNTPIAQTFLETPFEADASRIEYPVAAFHLKLWIDDILAHLKGLRY